MNFHVDAVLSGEEMAALRTAAEHVRVHMAHAHSWADRDAAMSAIGKVIASAKEQPKEIDRLVAEMEALPEYRGWQFSYEFPGYFCYTHRDNAFSVFCTPDWEQDETLPIQVQVNDGECCEEHDSQLPLPFVGRTGQKIFDLVRPTLDKLLTSNGDPR